jgi:chloramphenicol 3-O-phosphotransferase
VSIQELTAEQWIADAIADRQRVPDTTMEISFDDYVLMLHPAMCERARVAARAAHPRHNPARPVFAEAVIDALARQIADAIGADPLGGGNLFSEADLAEIRAELRADPGVRTALDELWPMLTPWQLVPADAPLDALDTAARLLGQPPAH